MDPGLNALLKWSIENSQPNPDGTPRPIEGPRNIDPATIQQILFNAPSDVDQMKAAMTVIRSNDPDVSLENKLIAFDNFEQLVENLDNANNIDVLRLWPPLIAELQAPDAERRMMAAWCIGTAVQNNEKSQEKLLSYKVIPKLLTMSLEDTDKSAKRKAIYALSSGVRNYQPALDALIKELPAEILGPNTPKIDASDMDKINEFLEKLKGEA